MPKSKPQVDTQLPEVDEQGEDFTGGNPKYAHFADIVIRDELKKFREYHRNLQHGLPKPSKLEKKIEELEQEMSYRKRKWELEKQKQVKSRYSQTSSVVGPKKNARDEESKVSFGDGDSQKEFVSKHNNGGIADVVVDAEFKKDKRYLGEQCHSDTCWPKEKTGELEQGKGLQLQERQVDFNYRHTSRFIGLKKGTLIGDACYVVPKVPLDMTLGDVIGVGGEHSQDETRNEFPLEGNAKFAILADDVVEAEIGKQEGYLGDLGLGVSNSTRLTETIEDLKQELLYRKSRELNQPVSNYSQNSRSTEPNKGSLIGVAWYVVPRVPLDTRLRDVIGIDDEDTYPDMADQEFEEEIRRHERYLRQLPLSRVKEKTEELKEELIAGATERTARALLSSRWQ